MIKYILILIFLLPVFSYAEISLPAYTPNVVDTENFLSTAEVVEVNQSIDRANDNSKILGAVFIVRSLQGEVIEALSERAFRKWQLGTKGVDNGLLLVIAIDDRKSRIETGYGLEGDLPDVVARQILDDVFAPNMRQKNLKSAIVESFKAISEVRNHQPLSHPVEQKIEDPSGLPQGFTLWAVFATLLVFMPLVWNFFKRKKMKPVLSQLSAEETANFNKVHRPTIFNLNRISVFIIGFLLINPGIFIIILGYNLDWFKLSIIASVFSVIYLTVVCCIFKIKAQKYASVETLRAFIKATLAKQEARRQQMIADGLLVITVAGEYEYTEKYRQQESRRSSSSSSSSSSSGGGRSGGGGASSSW